LLQHLIGPSVSVMDSDKPTTRFAAEDRVAEVGEELKTLVDRGLISSKDVLSIIQTRLKVSSS
jgi:hypothetical protein